MSTERLALVLAGGDLPLPRLLAGLLLGVSDVIAADGGLRHAASLGVEPDLIIGDLDSVEPELLRQYPGVPVKSHPVDKDELDLELAIGWALERGARRLTVIGAFGGRFDQSVAALLIAARHARDGVRTSLHAGAHEVRPLSGGDVAEIDLPGGTVLSLLALDAQAVVSASGVAFPLAATPLPFGVGLGISNTALGGRVEVRVHAGTLALMVEHGLVDLRAGLAGQSGHG